MGKEIIDKEDLEEGDKTLKAFNKLDPAVKALFYRRIAKQRHGKMRSSSYYNEKFGMAMLPHIQHAIKTNSCLAFFYKNSSRSKKTLYNQVYDSIKYCVDHLDDKDKTIFNWRIKMKIDNKDECDEDAQGVYVIPDDRKDGFAATYLDENAIPLEEDVGLPVTIHRTKRWQDDVVIWLNNEAGMSIGDKFVRRYEETITSLDRVELMEMFPDDSPFEYMVDEDMKGFQIMYIGRDAIGKGKNKKEYE